MSITADREYRTFDKAEWGPGPWQDEPDKLQWVDKATGLDCLIVRNSLGALCGYVGVPPAHPCHGVSYNHIKCEPADEDGYDYPDVHGGLTYADACQEGEDEAKGVCHVPLPGRSAGVWWFGFDCAHGCDVAPAREMRERDLGLPSFREAYSVYRTVGYVQRECAKLAEQLVSATFEVPDWDRDED